MVKPCFAQLEHFVVGNINKEKGHILARILRPILMLALEVCWFSDSLSLEGVGGTHVT